MLLTAIQSDTMGARMEMTQKARRRVYMLICMYVWGRDRDRASFGAYKEKGKQKILTVLCH